MDDLIRLTAFQWLHEKVGIYGYYLPYDLIAKGFTFQGKQVTLKGRPGIWKPKVLELPISITTDPESNYNDTRLGNDLILYSYRGKNPNSWDNVALTKAMEKQVPLIYFYKAEVGKYLAEWPAYIVEANPQKMKFTVLIDEQSQFKNFDKFKNGNEIVTETEAAYRRKYATYQAIARLHQGEFRVRVLTAYEEQCAFCRLRHRELLDAAHIISDKEKGGEPIVPNGLSLCKIHHAAFDTNIVGVNPDYKIIVRKDILEEIDGPMLKYGIQDMHGQKIELPGKRKDQPDREKLAYRFERFLKAV
jgi:putative restriction endonuclease